jgi:hypothetical protein
VFELIDHGYDWSSIVKKLSGIGEITKVKGFTGL